MPPELNTEADAENLLLAAVMAPDGQDLDETKLTNGQDIDAEEETADGEKRVEGEEEEQKSEAKTKDVKTEGEAPEEDEIEVDQGEGKNPIRYKVSDLVAKAQQFDAIEGQKAEIIERVEREATEQATGRLRQVEEIGTRVAYQIQAALQMLQEPQPPSTDMLNPASQNYNPDQYHMAFAQYQRGLGQFNQAKALGQQLYDQAQDAANKAREERETRELQRLNRAWPEFSQPATMNKFVEDMGKSYGFTPQELDAVLTDHRQALVARDALAFRAMKAQSGDVKAKVEAKAPKLVRSKQEAKGTVTQQRDAGGKFVSGALGRLQKTNSDEDAAAFFTGLVKAGRI